MKIIISFLNDVSLQKILFACFQSFSNHITSKVRRKSPRYMSPDIIARLYFSNPWYCTVKFLQKMKPIQQRKWREICIILPLSIEIFDFEKNYVTECTHNRLYFQIDFKDQSALNFLDNVTSSITSYMQASS